MGKSRKHFRRAGLIVLIGFLLLVVVAVLLPVWFPWVLAPAARSLGLRYDHYERLGYERFKLHDVTFARSNFTFTAGTLEAFAPATLLWKNWQKETNPVYASIQDWELKLLKSESAPGPKTNSTPQLISRVDQAIDPLRAWLPHLVLTNGVVQLPDRRIELPGAEWQSGRLQAHLAIPNLSTQLLVTATLRGTTWDLALRDSSHDAQVDLAIAHAPQSVEVTGHGFWRSNAVVFTAGFDAGDLLPARATVRATNVTLSGARLGWPAYSEVRGLVEGSWESNAFHLDVTAQADASSETNFPPLRAALRVTGDTNHLTILQADASAPGLQLQVTPGASFDYAGRLRSGRAEAHWQADLAQLPWLGATGLVSGTLDMRPKENGWPAGEFSLGGTNVGAHGVTAETLRADGRIDWPLVHVQAVTGRLTNELVFAARGSYDFSNRVVQAAAEVSGPFPAGVLPTNVTVHLVNFTAEAHGPLTNLQHTGAVQLASAQLPGLRPMDVNTAWAGRQTVLSQWQATAQSDRGMVELAGSGSFLTNVFEVHLDALSLSASNQPLLALKQPFTVRAAKSTATNASWQMMLTPLEWNGPGGTIGVSGSAHWPGEGDLTLNAGDLRTRLLEPFLEKPLPPAHLEALHLKGGWTNGPARFALSARASVTVTNAGLIRASLDARSSGDAWTVEHLVLGTGSNEVVRASGILPLIVQPGGQPFFVIQSNAPLRLEAMTLPETNFWNDVAAMAGAHLVDPDVRMHLAGTWQQPQGTVTARLARATFTLKARPDQALPRVENLFANLELTPGQITLRALRLEIEGQLLRAEGVVPLKGDFGHGLPSLDLAAAQGFVLGTNLQLAAFAPLIPHLISPAGVVDLNLQVAPGPRLSGALTLTNAATRPLPKLGALREVSARIELEQEKVHVRGVRLLVGGEAVEVTGELDFKGRKIPRELPRLQLSITGTNVPLVRESEIILRSDLNLRVANQTNEIVVVSGEARLRDSIFLSELGDLAPGGVRKPERRPPYFAVTAEPLASWRLAMQVKGDRFLKVRTPFFRGEVSTVMDLRGTLREPIALGQVRIPEGMIQFPFGTLQVNQGLVSLTSDDPYRPQLLVTAAGKTFGYDIKMEVTGTASEPLVSFSSTPPLGSEEILLMLTAAQMPRSQNFNSQQRAQKLAFFIGRDILAKFGNQEAADRLVVRSGEHISERGKETYYIEYKLTEDWSLIGEYDRFDAYNAGVKWRIYSR